MSATASVVSAAGPEDVIAAVWFALDRRPVESLVLAGLHGPRHRLGALVRCDLGPFGPGDLSLPLTRLRETGAAAVIALVFSEGALTAHALASRLLEELGAVPVLDVLGVTADAYVSLCCCGDVRCCPPAGHPITRVTASRAAVVHVVAGHQLAPVATPAPAPGGVGRDRVDWYLLWCRALVGGEPAGGLGEALADGLLRDAVLLNLMGASGRWINDLLTAPGEPFASALGDDAATDEQLAGLLARRPDPERIERGRQVLAALVERTAPGRRAPALAVLAMLAWLDGLPAAAMGFVAAADRTGDEVSLARLVAELIARGIDPPWQA